MAIRMRKADSGEGGNEKPISPQQIEKFIDAKRGINERKTFSSDYVERKVERTETKENQEKRRRGGGRAEWENE